MIEKSMKIIALFRFLRGGAAFILAFGMLAIYQDSIAIDFSHYLGKENMFLKDPIFLAVINWLSSISKQQLFAAIVLASLVGLLRCVEGLGLWGEKVWAPWMASLTGLVYIPFEINELINHFNVPMLCILIINCLVVVYLISVLRGRQFHGELKK